MNLGLDTAKTAAVLLLCTVLSSACTNLRPLQMPANEAQRLIGSGQLLEAGDKVSVMTVDGNLHEFTITAIDTAAGTVEGADESVRIADIATVAKRVPAIGKTIGLVIGIVGGLQLGAAIGDSASFGL